MKTFVENTIPPYVQEISDLRDQLKAAATKNRDIEAQVVEIRKGLKEIARLKSLEAFPAYRRIADSLLSTTLGEKFLEEVEFLKCERDNALALVRSYDRQDEVIGPEFEGVENVTEVIALLKEQVTTTQKKLAAARDVVSKLEYSNVLSQRGYCPMCIMERGYPHNDQCALSAVLKDADASDEWVSINGELVNTLEYALQTIANNTVRNEQIAKITGDTIHSYSKKALEILAAARSTSTQGTK